MSDYVPRSGKYKLPGTVYLQTIWTIRDYFRFKSELGETTILHGIDYGGMHSSNSIGDPTYNAAVKRADSRAGKVVAAVEGAIEQIPAEYRRGVWRSVMFREPYPIDADRTTYSRHKQRFVGMVAVKLGYIATPSKRK